MGSLGHLPARYGVVAMLLHWAIAVLLVANLALGLYFTSLAASDPGKAFFSNTHKSIGLTVLTLSLLRLLWRLFHPAPPAPRAGPAWISALAIVVHWSFYSLLILLPLAGWALVSVSPLNLQTLYFGLLKWPAIGFLHALPMAARRQDTKIFVFVHGALALLTAVLVAGHVAAALWHSYRLKDGVLNRMLPV
jgi:cytochrome b561